MELKNGTVCETIIVPVENVMAGYGIASDDAISMQIGLVAMFGAFGILMAAGCVVMMVSGKKKMKV